jgi:hypothetical protein
VLFINTSSCFTKKKKVRCPTCNASRYKMNYENADDGSVDNRKKKGQNQKETTDEGEEEVNERF